MEDTEKEELIRKLQDSREFTNQLLNMEKKEQSIIEQKVELATEIKDGLDDALYKLTCDIFYKKKGEKQNGSQS